MISLLTFFDKLQVFSFNNRLSVGES